METHSKYFFQNQKEENDDLQMILIADTFSTPANVGSIIRLAANIGIDKVVVLNGKHLRESKVKKTAGAALNHVDVVYTDTEKLKQFIPSDFELCALETVEGAGNVFESILPSKMALVLGNEKYGVTESVLSMCSSTFYIPMPGSIKSMNVSHAATACVFEWLRQQHYCD